MVDPINYSGLLTQVNLAPLQQGLAQRRQNQILEDQMQERQQVRQLAQAKFEYDKQKDADYLAAVEAYKQNPTPAALRDLAIRFPDQSAALMKAGESYSGAQKQDLLGAGFGALGALSSGKNDLAIKTLEDRVTALKGSGIDTSHTQAAIDMIKSGDVKGAQAYLSYAMSGLVGADHAAGILDSLGVGAKAEDRRADNERQAASQAETARHNRVMEGQGAARVDLSRQAGDRAAAKANGTPAKGTRKLPTGFVLD